MIKNILLTVLLFLSTTCLLACTSETNDAFPKTFVVMAGDEEIETFSETTRSNNEACGISDVFEIIMSDYSKEAIPYVEFDEEIHISLPKSSSELVEIQDFILRSNGNLKYDIRTVVKTPIRLEKGVTSFVLERNWASSLSSNTEDYKQGVTLRGFKITCEFDDEIIEYAFILRTDG